MPNLPAAFVSRMTRLLGAEADAFFSALDGAPALALRVNLLRGEAAFAASRAFAGEDVPWVPDGYYLREDTRPGRSLAHFSGAFYLQEASAMAAVAALDPRGGERVLDLCAAPGGKSTQIASALGGKGLLVCNEYDAARAKVLAANLERLGVANAVAVNARPDALAARWSGFFDAVLCDAPCSGEGMFRREPASRGEWTAASPAGCALRQAEILKSAAELVRPGGRLVYSTCTFAPEEDEAQIEDFLRKHPDFAPEEFELEGVGRSEGGMLRLYPHLLRGDGHFCARLRKRGGYENTPGANAQGETDDPSVCESGCGYRDARQGKRSKAARGGKSANAAQITDRRRGEPSDRDLLDLLEKDYGRLSPALTARVERLGDYLYALPPELPDTSGLRLTKTGVCLCRVARDRVEPEHALAMLAEGCTPQRIIELDEENARRYLRGEALEMDGEKGWTLLTHNKLPLGLGKCTEGQIKNHLPKGLRQ